MRRSGEPIEVRCRADVPVRFRRPGTGADRTRAPRGPRWYAVRAVLGFWVESGAWWRSSAARAALALDDSAPATAAGSTGSTGTGGSAGSAGTGGTGDRVVWRVEARAERQRRAVGHKPGDPEVVGVYELVRGVDGRWSLARTAD